MTFAQYCVKINCNDLDSTTPVTKEIKSCLKSYGIKDDQYYTKAKTKYGDKHVMVFSGDFKVMEIMRDIIPHLWMKFGKS